MKFLSTSLLMLFALSPVFVQAEELESARPPAPRGWICQANDFQGVLGVGYGETRDEAEDRAILNCQQRSHGSCMLQSCVQQ